jgi:hypothetical protein
VIAGAARMPHELMLLACIPPVFVALVMGFVMALYAGETYGPGLPAVVVIAGAVLGWRLPRRYAPRDQLIAIYLAWAVGMAFALVGVQMPDAA